MGWRPDGESFTCSARLFPSLTFSSVLRKEWNTSNPPRLGSPHTASLSYSPDYKIRSGKRGGMIFLEELRELCNEAGWCVREKRDVVYLAAAPPEVEGEKKEEGAKPKAEAPKVEAPKPAQADFTRTIIPTEVMLFRFSALTWNSHRIHYDQPYVTKVEGYKGMFAHRERSSA